jgi:ABC-type spermidine/putrescine transport system permease subunit I
VLVFDHALANAGMTPTQWLLMPFYVAFLPIAWAIPLRAPRRQSADATERVCIYAHLRLSQLRTGLRDLWWARATAWVMLVCALAANFTAWLMADASWRSDALVLLVVAVSGSVARCRCASCCAAGGC